jgi:hypothetical protein
MDKNPLLVDLLLLIKDKMIWLKGKTNNPTKIETQVQG